MDKLFVVYHRVNGQDMDFDWVIAKDMDEAEKAFIIMMKVEYERTLDDFCIDNCYEVSCAFDYKGNEFKVNVEKV